MIAQADAAQQLAARNAQWDGHALVMTGNPCPGVNGVYFQAGTANGAPYGKHAVTDKLLYFVPYMQEWRVSYDIAHLNSTTCVARCPCTGATTTVPEGENQWAWYDTDGEWKKATVRVSRAPEAEARRQIEVCACVRAQL